VITVALDVMGADAGVGPLVSGAAQLSLEGVPIRVKLVGDERAVADALAKEPCDAGRLELVHAASAVGMEEKPAEALDARPDCSILRAARLVAEGGADVLVSAGNTGAVILAASRSFARLPGVKRVGLAAVYPTIERHGPHGDPFALMLDVGATLSCSPDELVAFALMGSAYSRVVSDVAEPRVALLSNGAEAHKGTPAVVEAHRRLAGLEAVRFAGNVEGLDIPRGSVEVVVCEGFIGNIVLKMLEGVSEVARDLAKHAYAEKLRYKLALGMLSSGIRKLRDLTDWKQYGGAPIVGFDRAVIKAHGRSNARAVRNAIKVAAKTVERKLVEQIRGGLETAGT
jgi:glycerol-3-phosphate acyltransferase PlsX